LTARKNPSVAYWLDNHFSLYLNITNKCSNQCWFCFRNYKRGVGGFNLKLDHEPSIIEILAELKNVLPLSRWSEVVFCGFGEPTARLDVLLEVTRWIRQHVPSGMPIRLDTNGHGCALNDGRDVVRELKTSGITQVSVSLNGYNEESYVENCRPSFIRAYEATLDFIRKAKTEMEVEVSAVRLPEVDLKRVRQVVEALGVPFRIREYIPCFW
jgi:TatD family-associated radical SAM protein